MMWHFLILGKTRNVTSFTRSFADAGSSRKPKGKRWDFPLGQVPIHQKREPKEICTNWDVNLCKWCQRLKQPSDIDFNHFLLVEHHLCIKRYLYLYLPIVLESGTRTATMHSFPKKGPQRNVQKINFFRVFRSDFHPRWNFLRRSS